MQPENQQPQQPIQPQPPVVPPFQPQQPMQQAQQPLQQISQPIQPTQPMQVVQPPQPVQPGFVQPQPSTVPQPSAFTQNMTGMQPPTAANLEKQKKAALWLSILSIVIFIVGLLLGYVLTLAAVLGAYGLITGIRAKSKLLIILGSVGFALNLLTYVYSAIYNIVN